MDKCHIGQWEGRQIIDEKGHVGEMDPYIKRKQTDHGEKGARLPNLTL